MHWASCLVTTVPMQARPSYLCQACLVGVLPSQDAEPYHLVWGYRADNIPQGAWERVSMSRPTTSETCMNPIPVAVAMHLSTVAGWSHCSSGSHRSLLFRLPADLTFTCCRQRQQLLLEPARVLQSAGRTNRSWANCQVKHVKHLIHNNAQDTSKISPCKSHPDCSNNKPKHLDNLVCIYTAKAVCSTQWCLVLVPGGSG